ncbi:hypothetical protein KCP69_02915 [Salmonella enterica subsp. enterica]|nr:hypothetical protein KCP69_02915 [Salmonella enterica subsp. enterica]
MIPQPDGPDKCRYPIFPRYPHYRSSGHGICRSRSLKLTNLNLYRSLTIPFTFSLIHPATCL